MAERRAQPAGAELKMAPSNIGMQRTAASLFLIVNLGGFSVECAAADAGR